MQKWKPEISGQNKSANHSTICRRKLISYISFKNITVLITLNVLVTSPVHFGRLEDSSHLWWRHLEILHQRPDSGQENGVLNHGHVNWTIQVFGVLLLQSHRGFFLFALVPERLLAGVERRHDELEVLDVPDGLEERPVRGLAEHGERDQLVEAVWRGSNTRLILFPLLQIVATAFWQLYFVQVLGELHLTKLI